jgi:hypothetical protein
MLSMRHPVRGLSALVIFVFGVANAAVAATAPSPAPGGKTSPAVTAQTATFEQHVQPLLKKYCYECHGTGGKEDEGDFHLPLYKSASDLPKDRKMWEQALDHLRNRQMPPENASELPTKGERDLLADWIDRQLYAADAQNPDPGRVIIHRLNRAEYNNSIRDLLGVDFRPADDFPADDSGYGFDNISDVLSLSPMLLAKYVKAAQQALDQAVPTQRLTSATWHFPANQGTVGFNDIGDRGDGWVQILSLFEGDITVELDVPVTGEYNVSFHAFGQNFNGNIYGASGPIPNSPPETPVLSLYVNDTVQQAFTIEAVEGSPATYQGSVSLAAGKQRVRLVMRRHRGGADEQIVDTMARYVGRQSNGITWVKWIRVDGPGKGAVTRQPAARLAVSGPGEFTAAGARVMRGNGDVTMKFKVAKEGDYILRAYADAAQAGKDPAILDLRVDGKSLGTIPVLAPAAFQKFNDPKTGRPWTAPEDHLVAVPERYEVRTHLMPGEKTFAAVFPNFEADPENPNPNLRARTLTIHHLEVVEVEGTAPVPPVSPVMREYFATKVTPQNKVAVARERLAKFALRAWRRPPESAELDRLVTLFRRADQEEESFEAAIKLPLTAILVSPNFLLRAELPEANAAAAKKPAAAAPAKLGVPLDEFSLATRLSYFLWSSVPDDELLDLAAKKQLRKQLPAQVARMLASPKARALVDNFAGQWLQFRALSGVEPDKTLFPRFSTTVRSDMEKETALFFEHVMRENRPLMDFLTADYTFVNERLAQFYGLPAVAGEGFQRVSLANSPRRGVLGQGSLLVLTSNPTRTSPVKRGRFVLDNILGTPVPAPPPGVVVNIDAPEQANLTVRQRIEQHRSDPRCASCHALMDPIGMGFENFDAVGQWREKETEGGKTAAVDATGKLVSGETFEGALSLIKILSTTNRGDYYRNLATKMLTYALGRGVNAHGSDRLATDQVVQRVQANDTFSTLVLAVVESVPFQQMRSQRDGVGGTASLVLNDAKP